MTKNYTANTTMAIVTMGGGVGITDDAIGAMSMSTGVMDTTGSLAVRTEGKSTKT